jgi:hypothetical protein
VAYKAQAVRGQLGSSTKNACIFMPNFSPATLQRDLKPVQEQHHTRARQLSGSIEVEQQHFDNSSNGA